MGMSEKCRKLWLYKQLWLLLVEKKANGSQIEGCLGCGKGYIGSTYVEDGLAQAGVVQACVLDSSQKCNVNCESCTLNNT